MMTHFTYLTLSDPFIGLKLTYLSNRLSTSADMSVCGSGIMFLDKLCLFQRVRPFIC